MKKYLVFTLLIAMVGSFVFFSSCKKETLPSMSASFDGTSKNFIFRSTTRGTVPTVGEGFIIIGTTIDSQTGNYLTLLTRGVAAGTYSLDVALSDGKYECEAIYRPGGSGDTTKVYVGKSGSITIAEVDEENKTVSGTFSFTLVNKLLNTDVISVTNGTFENLKYINATLSTDDFDL